MTTDPAVTEAPNARRAARGERLPRTSLFVAVVLVGIITILDVVAVTLVLLSDREAPDGLIALGGAGLGSLGTFLARGQGNT